ncbi:hypothetical protein JCM33374_g3167 [Metschnikowia sp. JCM 33374]|nr:hypothetical protein JCM33374_g3167 [Metschnikowia sp. JCM 33374]
MSSVADINGFFDANKPEELGFNKTHGKIADYKLRTHLSRLKIFDVTRLQENGSYSGSYGDFQAQVSAQRIHWITRRDQSDYQGQVPKKIKSVF